MICCLIVACKAGRPGEWEMLEMEEAICVVSEWEQHATGGAATSAPSTKSMAQPKTIKAKAQAKREVRRQRLGIQTVFSSASRELGPLVFAQWQSTRHSNQEAQLFKSWALEL